MFCDGAMASRRILLILVFYCYAAFADLVVKPKDTESKVGATTFLNCSTKIVAEEIFWFHYQVGSKDRKLVYGYGQFYVPYQGRFELEKESLTDQSAYNLVIPSVTPQDSGIYECQDGAGHGEQSPQVDMVVLDDDPLCQSDMRHGSVVGPNSCGLPTENLDLTCKVKFHGNQPPIVAWFKDKSNQPITEHVTQSVSDDSIIYNLTIKADSSIDGSRFECRTTRSSTKQYQCTSEVVTVVGSNTLTIVIICLACALPIFLFGGFFGGWRIRKCKKKKAIENTEESRQLLNKSTSQADANETSLSRAEEGEELTAEKERLLEKVYRLEEFIYSKDKTDKPNAQFIQNIKTQQVSVITGITILRNHLFVVHENYPGIEVYDSKTFTFEKTLLIKDLKNPLDIASSDSSDLGGRLYVVDLHSEMPGKGGNSQSDREVEAKDSRQTVADERMINEKEEVSSRKPEKIQMTEISTERQLTEAGSKEAIRDIVKPSQNLFQQGQPQEKDIHNAQASQGNENTRKKEEDRDYPPTGDNENLDDNNLQISSHSPGEANYEEIEKGNLLTESHEKEIEIRVGTPPRDTTGEIFAKEVKKDKSLFPFSKRLSKDGSKNKTSMEANSNQLTDEKREKSYTNTENDQQTSGKNHSKDDSKDREAKVPHDDTVNKEKSILNIKNEQNKNELIYQTRCFIKPIGITDTPQERPWPVDDIDCRVSVCERNVIVMLCEKRHIIVHSLKGKGLFVVKLSPSDGFGRLFHAIQVSETDFAVTHNTPISKIHRLSLIDKNGKVKFSVGRQSLLDVTEINFNMPMCLVENRKKDLLVADSGNHRILQFDATLDKPRELVKKEVKPLLKNADNLDHCPWRIALDDANGRLFVTLRQEIKHIYKNKGISVFNVT